MRKVLLAALGKGDNAIGLIGVGLQRLQFSVYYITWQKDSQHQHASKQMSLNDNRDEHTAC